MTEAPWVEFSQNEWVGCILHQSLVVRENASRHRRTCTSWCAGQSLSSSSFIEMTGIRRDHFTEVPGEKDSGLATPRSAVPGMQVARSVPSEPPNSSAG